MKLKALILAATMMPAANCATVRMAIGANPEAVAAGIIYAEQRVGTDCVAKTAAGQPVDAARVARLLYLRIIATATLLQNFGTGLLAAVNDARTLSDEFCGRPARAPLTELPVVIPPVEVAPPS